ncbi:MAG TPA: hypothetical protein VFB72_19785, partial [Verrucomicrobiae bacterium]|nr:hypothetical protein [Verrucomicrobiae bacterium]
KETSAILAEIEDVVVDEVNVWNNFINTTLANSEENLIKAVLPWFMGSERKVRQFLNPERDRALTIPLLCKFELARYEKLDVKVARRGGIEGWQRAARYFEDHVDTCCRVLGLRELFAEHVAANAEKVEKLKGMIGELKNANAELEGALEKIQKS